MKIFKFMDNYNSWKIYLQVKKLTLDIFNHMLPLLPPFSLSLCCSWGQNCPPGSIITPQVTMTWNMRLFVFYVLYDL